MATTTAKTILQKLRLGLATNPSNPEIAQALKRERRRLMSYDPATIGTDVIDDLKAAYDTIKLAASAVAALGEAKTNAELAIIS